MFCIPFYIPQFPMGFGMAASVRVGTALGAGNVEQATSSCKVSIICTRKNKCINPESLRVLWSHWIGPSTDFTHKVQFEEYKWTVKIVLLLLLWLCKDGFELHYGKCNYFWSLNHSKCVNILFKSASCQCKY